jgi:hypothetical protein
MIDDVVDKYGEIKTTHPVLLDRRSMNSIRGKGESKLWCSDVALQWFGILDDIKGVLFKTVVY